VQSASLIDGGASATRLERVDQAAETVVEFRFRYAGNTFSMRLHVDVPPASARPQPGLGRISPTYRKPDTPWQHRTALTEGMISSDPARAAASRPPSLPTPPASAARETGVTVYSCDRDEAVLFRQLAPHFGVVPTITAAAASEADITLVSGNRCISVGHKTPLTQSTLSALSRAGVRYISTRSVGYNHIDVAHAEAVGIRVGNVSYSPDAVADYTLMLMLMALRNARSILSRAEVGDYRLNDVRGKELRDLTVGVVGTGRIGTAVIARLRGFGCRVLACDSRPKAAADYVPLEELLRFSDVVTFHTPLTPETHHLLDRRRIEQMRPGAFIVNTGRGSLLDTEALVSALETGELGGAALDVLEGEEGIFYADCRDAPLENDLLRRLQKLPNVLISPHTAYHTERALRDTVENTLINCLKFESETQHA
jgi:D-specific alpha-keto acid dehydrogenase